MWAGNVDHHGYGRLTVRRDGKHAKVRAHRAMEQTLRDGAAQLAADDAVPGPWYASPLPTVKAPPLDPERETLDHLCACTGCINPDHWQPLPNAENARRQQAQRPSGWWAR